MSLTTNYISRWSCDKKSFTHTQKACHSFGTMACCSLLYISIELTCHLLRIAVTPMLFVGFIGGRAFSPSLGSAPGTEKYHLSVIFTRAYTLQRTVNREGKPGEQPPPATPIVPDSASGTRAHSAERRSQDEDTKSRVSIQGPQVGNDDETENKEVDLSDAKV